MPALVIFDCDGVLIDSEHLAVRAEARLFRRLGLDIDEAFIHAHHVGLSWQSQLKHLQEHFSWQAPADITELNKAEIHALFETDLKPISGVADLLDRLATPRCVASSSDPERLRYTLGLTGLYDLLAPHIFSATMVKHGKPAPDLFLYAANAMKVVPADCLVIEDSVPGVTAARAAGMQVIGFIGGSHAGPDLGPRLSAAGAVMVLPNMDLIAAELGL
jgi:HAD superfamily hydrolase (TIGR01509 family)